MQTLEAIHTRRSIRAFTTDPISEDAMLTIVRAAAAAPSGGNAQMWAFIGIREPGRLASLRALCPGIIGKPAGVIVLCLDLRRRTAKPEGQLQVMPYFDIGAAMQNILLAAHDLGLGGCAVGSFHAKGLRAFLNLPEAVEPCLLVVLGRPKFIPASPPKRPLEEIYFSERYEADDGRE